MSHMNMNQLAVYIYVLKIHIVTGSHLTAQVYVHDTTLPVGHDETILFLNIFIVTYIFICK